MKWEPIENCPKDRTPFLAVCYTKGRNAHRRWVSIVYAYEVQQGNDSYTVYRHQENEEFVSALFWMPIPPPPKAEEKGTNHE